MNSPKYLKFLIPFTCPLVFKYFIVKGKLINDLKLDLETARVESVGLPI